MRTSEYELLDSQGKILIKVFHSCVGTGERVFQSHHHTQCELSLFVEGKGIYTTDSGKINFNKGDMFMFSADETHCITRIDESINLLNIHFEPRMIWERSDTAELLQFIFQSSKKNKFDSSDTKLKSIIETIEKEISGKKFGYEIEIKRLVFSALIHIIRTYYGETEPVLTPVQSDITKKLKKVVLYIEDNLESNLTLGELAKIACMSQTYFSAVFKKYNGISPWNYIIIKRIDKAIFLLKTTDLKIIDVASQCGFSSSSNFYKEFKTITGKQPNDFRN